MYFLWTLCILYRLIHLTSLSSSTVVKYIVRIQIAEIHGIDHCLRVIFGKPMEKQLLRQYPTSLTPLITPLTTQLRRFQAGTRYRNISCTCIVSVLVFTTRSSPTNTSAISVCLSWLSAYFTSTVL